MEGSAGDPGAPDSWESADLDESMSRLMVSSKKKMDSFRSLSSPLPDFDDETGPYLVDAVTGPTATASSSVPGELRGAVSEDALNQVDQFLREALEKPRERLSILRMEQDIIKFIRDPNQHQLEFQDLPTSYLRLAAHRVAQHYYLQSVAMPESVIPDGSGSQIVIHKTSYCRIPHVRLADIPVNLQLEDANNLLKIAIKQRPLKSSQTGKGLGTSSKSNSMKTVEERKEEYNKARARIFSNINDTGTTTKLDFEHALPDLQKCPLVSSSSDDPFFFELSETNLKRSMSNSSIVINRSFRNRHDKEPVVPRQHKSTNRVAIFRDRELDRKDPDYDRNYDRYMQRFDPGFGFNGGPYAMQPLYVPAVNYNSEFPQLGTVHRPQISIEHQSRPTQQLHGPWPTASTSSAIKFGPPEGLMAPYSPNYIGAHPTSSIYLHSSQFPVTPRPIQFLHAHEQAQYPQSHQQQSEVNFGLARPR